jgi:hypothetical protein
MCWPVTSGNDCDVVQRLYKLYYVSRNQFHSTPHHEEFMEKSFHVGDLSLEKRGQEQRAVNHGARIAPKHLGKSLHHSYL